MLAEHFEDISDPGLRVSPLPVLSLMCPLSLATDGDALMGEFFIDRDGELFQHVLAFLRTQKLLIPTFSTDPVVSTKPQPPTASS